jgi:hypothetical protein
MDGFVAGEKISLKGWLSRRKKLHCLGKIRMNPYRGIVFFSTPIQAIQLQLRNLLKAARKR